jgi:hypothetical protein
MQHRLSGSLGSWKMINKSLAFQLLLAVIVVAGVFIVLDSPQKEVSLQNTADISLSEIESIYLSNCGTQKCVMEAANEMTVKYGPEKAVKVFELFNAKERKTYLGDPHIWVHQVGVQTAKRFGTTGEAFIRCPSSFNYGCMHGFFENSSLQTGSLKITTEQICGSLEKNPNYSDKYKFYCYHGAGHGIMQSVDYDLSKGLAVCDELSSRNGQEGCWQGLFMEGNNGANEGEAPVEIFSTVNNPLAPCNKVAAKHKYQCYINLGGRLVLVMDSDVKASANACLGADSGNVRTCLEGVAIMVSNETWQSQIPAYKGSDLLTNNKAICDLFPTDYTVTCVQGIVAETINMDMFDPTRAIEFCKLISKQYSKDCYIALGQNLRAQATDTNEVAKQCSRTPHHYIADCRRGARI